MNQPAPLEVDGRLFIRWAVVGVLGFTLVMGIGTFGIGVLWGRYIKAQHREILPPSEAPIHPGQ